MKQIHDDCGQAVVEFTLVFILTLIIAWIPADFGLAIYTAQLAQNASREGARIAAADPNVAGQVGMCTLAACYALPSDDLRHQAALRLSSALMPDTKVSLALDGIPCNQQVIMKVEGTYNYFFYRLLRWFGATGNLNTANVTRQTSMRWEHQKTCG